MQSLNTVVKAITAIAVLMVFSAMSFAQTDSQQTSGEPRNFETVEELLDIVSRYNGQKVRVSGEVEEIIDQQAFVLESGGLFNDEMVVLMPKGQLQVEEDYEVAVTGTVRTVGLIDIEREYGWDLDPHVKLELEHWEAFLIADRIEIKEKD